MDIFLHQNGAQTGPYSEQQIRDMLKSGAAKPADYAWHDGMTDWKPLNEVTNLRLAPVPPPVPTTATRPAAGKSSRAADEKPAFRLHPVVIVFLVLYALGVSFVAFRRFQAGGADQVPSAIGTLAGSIMGPVLFAYIAWLIFRRSAVAANIVCCLALAGGVNYAIQNIQKQASALEKLKEMQNDVASTVRQNLASGSSNPTANVKMIDKVSQQLGGIANDLQGNDRQAMLAVQELTQQVGALMQKYNSTHDALVNDGFAKAKGINTRDDLQRRKGLAKAFSDANPASVRLL